MKPNSKLTAHHVFETPVCCMVQTKAAMSNEVMYFSRDISPHFDMLTYIQKGNDNDPTGSSSEDESEQIRYMTGLFRQRGHVYTHKMISVHG